MITALKTQIVSQRQTDFTYDIEKLWFKNKTTEVLKLAPVIEIYR